ncbi:hypothetical protein C3L33_23483, partial [Rhododendron williamsianum]
AANRNLEFACSRWSIDTHSFAWAWGESGLSLEDVSILTRLSLRGGNIVDLAKLSWEDRDDVEALRALHKQAQNGPIFTVQGVRKAAVANTKKTSLGSWLRYFFKDLQPARTVAPSTAQDFVAGPQYRQRLYMAGFFSYFLSYYVLPDYPIDGLSQAVFPLAVLLARSQLVALAPLFLGSLYRQLDLVQADYARSLASGLRSHAEQWHGTSSEASWYEACDIEANFTQRPYSIPSPGVMGVGQCLLPAASSLRAASGGDPVARTVINAALIALPGWLLSLCNETTRSQLRFMAGQLSPILAHLGDSPIPDRDRVSTYTQEFRAFWRRNLDSFLTFVCGQAVVPEACTIRTRDTSLRAITGVRAVEWRRPRSQWAVIHAAPLNRAPAAGETRRPKRLRNVSVFPRAESSHYNASSPRFLGLILFVLPFLFLSSGSGTLAPLWISSQRRPQQRRQRNKQRAGRKGMPQTLSPNDAASMPAGGPTAEDVTVVDISDSPEKQREAEVIQPRAEPIPFPHPEPESSAVVGGTLPDEPSVVDLGGDPNTISSESSSSSDESENVIVYSADRDPSPSNAAPSEAREPPPSTDTRESVGQADIAAEPINAATARLLREEEEDDVEGLPHAAAGGPAADQPGAGSTSTPSGSHQ